MAVVVTVTVADKVMAVITATGIPAIMATECPILMAIKSGLDNPGKSNKSVSDDVAARVSFDHARHLAVNYGLTGYESLPPGIAKNLARGKPLPPGIAKKTVPASMLGQLPNYPGYEWRVVGDDLVLVALSTAIVTSIINGVFK